ncbi:MAG: hypothetical protein JWR00_4438 [Rubritepida sp.]|nr:hypothetical protein [Rubritepida sp.]
MSALAISAAVFASTLLSGFIGLALARKLPQDHIDQGSKDCVRLVMGFVSTVAALVLSMLIASAKNNYDVRGNQLQTLSAGILSLDHLLWRYGAETAELRIGLRNDLTQMLDQVWNGDRFVIARLGLGQRDRRLVDFAQPIQSLPLGSEDQRATRNQAIQMADTLNAIRVQMTQVIGRTIPYPVLLVLGSWMTALFFSFGMFARPNRAVLGAMTVGAICLAGAIFLILELDQPFDGIMGLSDAPLRQAIGMIGHDE